MINDSDFSKYPDPDGFYERSERIDGPPVLGFNPTLQELVQIVKFHTQEFIELYWHAFFDGQEACQAAADAIWTRLEMIRAVMRPDDFVRTVEVACIQFGLEFDARIWEVFVCRDELLRQAAAVEIQQNVFDRGPGFSRKLTKLIAKFGRKGPQEVPLELLRRLAQPALPREEPESISIQ